MKVRAPKFEKFLDYCANGDLIQVLLYVRAGEDFTFENNLGLSLAIVNNHIEVAKYLMDRGANPYATGNMLPLTEACENGYFKMVKQVWSARYPYVKEYKNKNNKIAQKKFESSIIFTCLDSSLKNGNLSLINFWLDKGGKLQHNFEHLEYVQQPAKVYNGLDILCQRGHLKALHKLLEAKKAHNFFNNESHLICAAKEKEYEIVKYLLDKGSSRNLLNNEQYSEILYYIEKEEFAQLLQLKINSLCFSKNENIKSKNKL